MNFDSNACPVRESPQRSWWILHTHPTQKSVGSPRIPPTKLVDRSYSAFKAERHYLRKFFFGLVAIAGVIFLAASPGLAQCAMCKAALEASTDVVAASKGLNTAAFVLLIPPVTIFAGLFGLFYKLRNFQERRDHNESLKR